MKNEVAQAFLLKVLELADAQVFEHERKYFQNMAKYKYDEYQQYAPGMRFIERFALWLNQFEEADRKIVVEFIKKRLVFISVEEMNLLVSSCFPDLIKKIFVKDVAQILKIEDFQLGKITSSIEYKSILRQSLFFGLSDGAKTDIFRRANSGIISHEQVYLTYELSNIRARKMHEDLIKDLTTILGHAPKGNDSKFKVLFLLDDFSASGTSYLSCKEDGTLRGKISQLYESIFETASSLGSAFDLENLKIHVVLYLCTNQAREQIEEHFDKLNEKYNNRPILHWMHLIPESFKVSGETEAEIISLCMKDSYYDPDTIVDNHTGANIQLGYKSCALPLILAHNSPNNSLSMLWSYEHSPKFKGLFPRIPRHRAL